MRKFLPLCHCHWENKVDGFVFVFPLHSDEKCLLVDGLCSVISHLIAFVGIHLNHIIFNEPFVMMVNTDSIFSHVVVYWCYTSKLVQTSLVSASSSSSSSSDIAVIVIGVVIVTVIVDVMSEMMLVKQSQHQTPMKNYKAQHLFAFYKEYQMHSWICRLILLLSSYCSILKYIKLTNVSNICHCSYHSIANAMG